MDAKKLMTATLAGFIVMFLLSGLWYMVILVDYYDKEMGNTFKSEVLLENPNLLYIGIGYLVLALLMAYAYPIGYKGGSPTTEGIRFGVFVGLLMSLPTFFVYVGLLSSGTGMYFMDVIFAVIGTGIGGLVIALVYGTGAAESEEASVPAGPPAE